jgi:hypothetical protein
MDPANHSPDKILSEAIRRISARVKDLETNQAPKSELIDMVKNLQEDHLKLRKFTVGIREYVSQLTPVHRHYYKHTKQKKEMSQ